MICWLVVNKHVKLAKMSKPIGKTPALKPYTTTNVFK